MVRAIPLKVERLSSRIVFQNLRSSKLKVGSNVLSASFVPLPDASPQSGTPAFAYAISRKVGSAVQRNLIRRRLRAIVREISAEIPVGAYLVVVKPGAATVTFDELATDVRQVVSRLKKKIAGVQR